MEETKSILDFFEMSLNKTLNIDRFERIFAYVTAERMSIIVPSGENACLELNGEWKEDSALEVD